LSAADSARIVSTRYMRVLSTLTPRVLNTS